MRVAIIGYGRMGRAIETVLKERNHEISATVDPFQKDADYTELSAAILDDCDGAIEFSSADGVSANAALYAAAGVKAVTGTTGWEAQYENVKKTIESSNAGYLWGSNFSIGAHIFFRLTETAAAWLNRLPEYDIMGFEVHHNQKTDSPSGTALRTAEKILAANDRKTEIVTERLDRRIEPNELHFASLRGGSVPGIHSVFLDSPADTIEIRHSARNRDGLALGSVMALEWLENRKGFFRVEDFIREIL